MPQTTKGPMGDGDNSPAQAPKLNAEDKRVQKALDLDDETWGRVMQQASSTQRTPTEVIAAAINNALGAAQPTGTWHSGQPGDPSLDEG